MAGKLSMVATPIGNLEDITLRALRTLKEADVIACEDTRVSKKLLAHFEIHKPLIAFHSNSGAKGFEKITALLAEGRHVAVVCDAGTPGISDPGLELVSIVRQYFVAAEGRLSEQKSGRPGDGNPRTFGREVVPELPTIEAIPGASSLSTALSIAGLRAAHFVFYGFLPLKKGRETLFKEMAGSERAGIFFESPHRILKALESLTKFLPPERRVGLFRELTKMYEEALIGTPAQLHAQLVADPQKQRGEFVVIVEGV